MEEQNFKEEKKDNMTISEMYENNKKIANLKELIENHNAIIASGRVVPEKFYEQLKDFKEELAGMTEISEEKIDEKVAEYEKIVDDYEKNNNRMKELKELIEGHNAIIASGRVVPEEFYTQLKDFKEELAKMTEVPQDKIMPYKKELAIAYKDKLSKVAENNKEYDRLEELVNTHKSIIESGIKVGEKYGDQYITIKNKLSNMKRTSDEDIKKYKQTIEEVVNEYEKNNNRMKELKELIEGHNAIIASGRVVPEEFYEQLNGFKEELAKMTEIPENEIKEYKEQLVDKDKTEKEKQPKEKETEEKNDQDEESLVPVEEKNTLFTKAMNFVKSVRNKAVNFAKKIIGKEEKQHAESEVEKTEDTAEKWRKDFKKDSEEAIKNKESEVVIPVHDQEKPVKDQDPER